jgi:hypothetical protein
MEPILVHTANRTLTEINFGCFATQVAQYSIDNSFSQTFGYIQFIEPNVVEFYYEANLTSGENGQLDALLANHDKIACDEEIDNIPSEESSDIGYDSSTSGLSSNSVQGAIDELAENNHQQNTDQYLDFGGANQISASEAKAKLDDAPSDSKEYARKDGNWVEVTDNQGIGDAPNDGNEYSRQNQSWQQIVYPVISVNGENGTITLDTDDITEGANKYYSTGLFNTDFSSKDTDDLSEGSSNLYWTTTRNDSWLTSKDTDDLAEGTKKYYSTSLFNIDFGNKNTDTLSEGSTNLYYTDARVSANSNVVANTSKISADGSINTHSDVDTAGAINGSILKYNSGNWVVSSDAGLINIVEDTTPQLGGDLDTNGNNITATSQHLNITTTGGNLGLNSNAGNIFIQANSAATYITGTSFVSIQGLKYPASDGSNNHFMRTDGSGNLSLDAISALVVTYDNSASGLTATNVKAALDEIEGRVDTNDSKVSADGSINTHSDVDMSTTSPVIGDRMIYDGINWIPEKPEDRYIELYQNAITTSTNSSTDVNVQWDVSKNTGALFTFSPTSAVVEINQDGYYFISYNISIDITSGNSRTSGRTRLYLDTGSGYSIVPGLTSYSYHRNSSEGEDTASKSSILQLSDGDKINVRIARESGSATLVTITGASNFTIFKI